MYDFRYLFKAESFEHDRRGNSHGMGLGRRPSRRRYEPREDDAWVEDASHLRSIHDRRSYLLGGGLCLSRARI